MRVYRGSNSKTPVRQVRQRNAVARARSSHRGRPLSKRARGLDPSYCQPFAPPEDWYEPTGGDRGSGSDGGYRFVVQSAGPGYRHVVTPAEIRDRLAQLPERFLGPLEVIQLSRMTRKKKTFPCYGMQWGSALYLYPIEETLVEYFYRPPQPNVRNETQMYGGRWVHEAPTTWKLIWTESTIRDYYLNNILIHELGHLLDDRNTTYRDRERFAEWFAIRHGYLASRATSSGTRRKKQMRRRHHAPARPS